MKRTVLVEVVAIAALMSTAACKQGHSPLDDTTAKTAPAPGDLPAAIDKIAEDVLAETGCPSASLAAVKDGKIIYVHAYGKARLASGSGADTPATPQMRYSIGSIAKQMTATAILLLLQDGKLALDDTVGKYVPGITGGDIVTIRQVLSHTAGYRDYAPQDYIIPEWLKPTTPNTIVERFGRAALDFEPGTKWQYSNTGFVIAGMIVEKVADKPLFAFLEERVFDKLGMASAVDVDRGSLAPTDPQGYFRRANGPPHPAPVEGAGWRLGAYELGMTAEDLAKWDIALIDRKILTPALTKILGTETLLSNGAGTHYGLGIAVTLVDQHRQLGHGGESSGFVSENLVLPDDKIAVAVLTNQDASPAARRIATKVRDALLRAADPNGNADEHVSKLLAELSQGRIDRSQLTANANAYFSDEAIGEYRDAISAAGRFERVEQTSSGRRGGYMTRRYQAKYATKTLELSVFETDDGKIEQFLIE